jgi:hypothetical protein
MPVRKTWAKASGVRTALPSNRTAHVLFVVDEGRITDAEPE